MNCTELIADVKRKAQFNSDQDTISDADILDLATKELQTVIIPKILAVRENFFATYTDFTLSNTRIYRIPPTAIGNKLLEVEVIPTGSTSRNINQLSPYDRSGQEGFYIRSSSIILTDNGPSSGTLRVHYSERPGVLTTDKGIVTTVSSTTSYVVNNTTLYVAGDLVSVQRPTTPYEYSNVDMAVSSVSGSLGAQTVNFSIQPTTTINARDVFTILTAVNYNAGIETSRRFAFYPQIPEELHDWLSYRTACRVLEHLGHQELLQGKLAKLQDLEADIMSLLSPRVNNQPKVISSGDLLGWRDY